MKSKLLEALRLAFPRFLVGAAGTWCVLGPILLLFASESASQVETIFLGALLVPCYAAVLVICIRAKWDALKELAAETQLAIGFMLVGLLLNELTGILLEIKHRLALVYSFAGFFVTELARPAKFFHRFNYLFRKEIPSSNPVPIKNELLEERTPRELPEESDKCAQPIAEVTERLAESQRAVRDYQQQQRLWQSAQADHQRLREVSDRLNRQLKASESQLRLATADSEVLVRANATLKKEVDALQQQLADRDAGLDVLERAAQDSTRRQAEVVENLRLENQGLRQEVTDQRIQLATEEGQSRELARQNRDAAHNYQRLEMEISDLHGRLNDYQSQRRELASLRQQLTQAEDRENYYRQQQPRLAARIASLERELAEAKCQAQRLDDTRRQLRDSECLGQQLAEENSRLWQEVARWRENLATGEDTRAATTAGNTKVIQTRTDDDSDSYLAGQSYSPTLPQRPAPLEVATWETRSSKQNIQTSRSEFGQTILINSTAARSHDQEEDASWKELAAAQRPWRSAALAASIALVAGISAWGIQGKRLAPGQEATLAIKQIPEENRTPAATRAQRTAAPQITRSVETIRPKPKRGTFQTVLSTQVYSGPSENSALVAAINAGMKVNVIDSRQGWLEIRSKHGRPPGFIRQETAVMVAQN